MRPRTRGTPIEPRDLSGDSGEGPDAWPFLDGGKKRRRRTTILFLHSCNFFKARCSTVPTKRQTLREKGTQSHGTLGVSRAAESVAVRARPIRGAVWLLLGADRETAHHANDGSASSVSDRVGIAVGGRAHGHNRARFSRARRSRTERLGCLAAGFDRRQLLGRRLQTDAALVALPSGRDDGQRPG